MKCESVLVSKGDEDRNLLCGKEEPRLGGRLALLVAFVSGSVFRPSDPATRYPKRSGKAVNG
jgi:hypothetical protein